MRIWTLIFLLYLGDSVVIRHFDHAWLKESWATYMEVNKHKM